VAKKGIIEFFDGKSFTRLAKIRVCDIDMNLISSKMREADSK